MTNLKIKTESLPQRCEICHKTDEFDPETGICGRCGDLPAEKFIEPVERLNLLQRAYMRADFLAALMRIRIRSFFEKRFQDNGAMRFAFYAFITLSMGLIIGLGMTVLLTISTMPNVSVKAVLKNDRLLTDNNYAVTDKQSAGAKSARDIEASSSVEYQPDLKDIFCDKPSDLNNAAHNNRMHRSSGGGEY